MTLAEAFRVLRRLWYLPFLFAIAGGACAGLIASRQGVVYRSDVNLVLTANVASGESKDVSNALVALDRRTLIGTLAVVAGSDAVSDAALASTRVDATDITEITGVAVADANVVTLDVAGTDGSAVEQVTAAAVEQTVDRFGRQYPLYRVESIDRPKPVVDHGAPWWQLLTAGIVGGGLLGVLVALSVDAARRSRVDRDPAVPMGYVAVPVEFVRPLPAASRTEETDASNPPGASASEAAGGTIVDLTGSRTG